jgi:hypothetical protein
LNAGVLIDIGLYAACIGIGAYAAFHGDYAKGAYWLALAIIFQNNYQTTLLGAKKK